MLTLTAVGKNIFERAVRMELEARAILSEGSEGSEASGTVRIAVTEAMAPFLVLEGLLSICEDYPALRLALLGGNRRLDLQTGEADLALRIDPLKGSRLLARCVLKAPVSIFAITRVPHPPRRPGRATRPARTSGSPPGRRPLRTSRSTMARSTARYRPCSHER